MGKKLIIFTNYDSLGGSIPEGMKKEQLKNYFQDISKDLKNWKSCKFENYRLHQVKRLEDGNIILLHDSIEKKEFNIFINEYKKDELYILHHSSQEEKNFNFSQFPYVKKGQHGDKNDAYCFFVRKIVELKDANRSIDIDEIIETIFGFDVKQGLGLDFLHNHFKGSANKDELKEFCKKVVKNDEERYRKMKELFENSQNIESGESDFNELSSMVFNLVKKL
ncbi:MAG: hypothetical protein Q4B43_10250 [Bacteroidota bacterium]|nr:hypothetical protein [Bacteroidota bacterium]